MDSNLDYRKDIRTDKEFNSDRNKGTKKQIQLLGEFVERHIEFVDSHPECPLKILDLEHIANEKLDKGSYRDALDGKLLIQIREKDPAWFRVEVEHVEKPGLKARFKKDKIERCIRRNAPIIHFQIGAACPMLFVFSPQMIKQIHSKGAYQCTDKFYGGKHFFEFNTMFPDPDVPNVAWPSLDPVEDYKEVLKALVL